MKSSTADFSRITRRISDENDKMSKTDWGLPEDVFPVTKEHCGRESGGAYIHKKKDFACYTENILKIYLFLSTFFSIFALVLLNALKHMRMMTAYQVGSKVDGKSAQGCLV